MRLIIPFLLMASLASAQRVSIGVKAGIPVTEALPNYGGYFSGMIDTGRWTIGPTIELNLFYGFSLEADALYRGYRQEQNYVSGEFVLTDGTTLPAVSSTYRTDSKAWDFPMLLKYRIGHRRYRPFVDAGATYSHTSSDVTSSLICLSSTSACSTYNLRPYYNSLGQSSFTENSFGPTAGAGVEFGIGRFKLAPEVRYTHLSNQTRNLVTVLVGFTF